MKKQKWVKVILGGVLFLVVWTGGFLIYNRPQSSQIALASGGLEVSTGQPNQGSTDAGAPAKHVVQRMIDAVEAERMDTLIECFKPSVRGLIERQLGINGYQLAHKKVGEARKRSDGGWDVELLRNGKLWAIVVIDGDRAVSYGSPKR